MNDESIGKLALVLLVGLLLSGCANPIKDQPVAYQEGHEAGCNTGYGVHTKNLDRYLSDELYAVGWNDGERECSARWANILDAQRDAMNTMFRSYRRY